MQCQFSQILLIRQDFEMAALVRDMQPSRSSGAEARTRGLNLQA